MASFNLGSSDLQSMFLKRDRTFISPALEFFPLYSLSLSLLDFLWGFCLLTCLLVWLFFIFALPQTSFWMLVQLSDRSLSVIWGTMHNSAKSTEVSSKTEGLDVYSTEDIHYLLQHQITSCELSL